MQGAAAALDDGQHGHADIRGPGLRAGEGRGGHHVLHPAPGEVTCVTCHGSRVTCPDAVLGDHHDDEHRVRGHLAQDLCGEASGLAVRHLRRPLHHAAHPHHRGQLQQVRTLV